jgi:subtilisin family serine protease
VASYTTKVQWTDSDGNPEKVKLKLDDISDFSSPGPLRKGGQKPDVAAPGAMIAAPLSADSQVTRANVVADGFRVMAGTSMATPFITGIVALLLEHNRNLGPKEIKDLLRQSSSIPGLPADAFDSKWGFGLIDGMRLLAACKSQDRKTPQVQPVQDHGTFITVGGVRVDKRTETDTP